MKVALFGYDFFFDCHQLVADHSTKVLRIFSYPADNSYNFNFKLQNLAKILNVEFVDRKVNGEDLKLLEKEGCDLLFVAAYPYRIPIELTPQLRGINVHPSLLPLGRGPWPLPWIILKGFSESGVTIHKIEESLDSGNILAQSKFGVDSYENLETLSNKVQIHAANTVRHCFPEINDLWSRATPQSDASSYWGRPNDEERSLKWEQPVEEIWRTARAFGKFDSYATFDGKEWIVQDVSVWREQHSFTPGEVVHRASLEVVVAAADGFVCLRYYKIDPDWEKIQ